MKPLFCEKCGSCPTIFIDGYDIGERLLEGIELKVEIKNGKLKNVAFREGNEDYLKELNVKFWIKSAKKHVQDLLKQDELSGVCVKCGSDVYQV